MAMRLKPKPPREMQQQFAASKGGSAGGDGDAKPDAVPVQPTPIGGSTSPPRDGAPRRTTPLALPPI
jgi:hypothetical protein